MHGTVDMTNIIQKLATQMPPGAMGGAAGGNIDIAQIMQTMGPLVSAMSASAAANASPNSVPRIANCDETINTRKRGNRKK